MSPVVPPERETQNRVRTLLQSLGYEYLGDWQRRAGNANVEVDLLERNLRERGYGDDLIERAVTKLLSDAALSGGRSLYEANQEVYDLLRYGVKVKPGAGEATETVWLIDWDNLETNHFAVAEEVTVKGPNSKRPDLVLYVNGIAMVTIELKSARKEVAEGIRQSIGNQRPEFIRQFFTTVQLVLAGNDAEGLRYGVIESSAKYWLKWKEPSPIEEPLDRGITQLCSKERLLELVHDFIIFDKGVKKVCRPNQYFGVKACQERIARREGGILWHIQGSGKSLTMVWLAKWIREHQPDARVLLVTDRDELDEQIQKTFKGVRERIYRTVSGSNLISVLNDSREWLICSLVHKFGDRSKRDKGADDFIRELNTKVPKDFRAKGNLFVFVDEAHRTQSGKLHNAMKALLPGAVFIGFTGTPLLKKDKRTTLQQFGSYIHTYLFGEAKADGVVLDLRYEARNVALEMTSPERIDAWFDAKTRGMTDLTRAEIKKRWGTVQKARSAEPRTRQIVGDILIDMETKPRLSEGTGNAILVTDSIYQACRFYQLFCDNGFKGKCAIVTSYRPQPGDIATEDSGHGTTEKIRQYEIYRQMLADHFETGADEAMKRVEQFETDVKERFVEHPGQMRLLIVVDKLLTGFDAPSATYLYIDKTMRDHNLFQAICRVNRVADGKEYGCIVDYRDLFNSLRSAISDYTSAALDGYDKADIDGLLSDRIPRARESLDQALERLRAICEPVDPPKKTLQYLRYFCGEGERLKENEPRRLALYKAVNTAARAFTELANDMAEAGYSGEEAAAIKAEIADYTAVRDMVKLGAGENVDFKSVEADMRHLLDTYIRAEAPETISDFGEVGLIELIVELGPAAVDRLPAGIRHDPEAVSETIANNMRKVIVEEQAFNPKYYATMSRILDEVLEAHRRGAMDYQTLLNDLADLAVKVKNGGSQDGRYSEWANNGARRALIDFLDHNEALAVAIDMAVTYNKLHSWIGNDLKEKKVRRAILQVLPTDFDRFEELFKLVKAQRDYW